MATGLSIASLVDVVIAITLIECLVLLALHRATRGLWATLASGLCLMLALHGALRGAGAMWIAFFLLAAGVAHGVDLWLRLPGRAIERRAARRP